MIIDMHTHIVPSEFPLSDGRPSGDSFPRMQIEDDERYTIIIDGKNIDGYTDNEISKLRNSFIGFVFDFKLSYLCINPT